MTIKASPPLDAAASVGGKHGHLDFLDGLRGLAAVYVLLFHAYSSFVGHQRSGWCSPFWLHFLNWMNYGRFAVDVFIVLSGFVLMWPVSKTADKQLRGGIGQFARRRFMRIFPPYYAALFITAGMVLLATKLHLMHARDMLTLPGFLAHLVMAQDLTYAWSRQIDGPMWSVATEWYIYFIFALLLLPVWRKYGMAATLGTAFVLGLAPHLLLPHYNFDWACPWYLSLFALGMWGAALVSGHDQAQVSSLKDGRIWSLAALIGTALIGALSLVYPAGGGVIAVPYPMLTDVLVGFTTVAFIIGCVQNHSPGGPISRIKRILVSPIAITFGNFSYSLYLVHQPFIQGIINIVEIKFHIYGILELMIVFCCFSLVFLYAYVFYLLFERPFLARRKNEPPREIAHDAVMSPAP